jgi:hypothetical protein
MVAFGFGDELFGWFEKMELRCLYVMSVVYEGLPELRKIEIGWKE